jgi:excisionase family DNA binding protein
LFHLLRLIDAELIKVCTQPRENDMSEQALSERPPTEDEVRQASEAARALATALTPQGLPFSVSRDGEVTEVELPPALGQLVLDVLTHVARGEMVTFVPYGAELTTKEAADLLNVSRPFLVAMLEQGKIPFHRVGSHRRVRASDLLAFRAARDAERAQALRDLQRLGQEFDAG